MKNRDWKEWWDKAKIRALKTIGQVAGAYIVASATIWDVDWKVFIGTVLLSGIGSLLTSLKGLPELEETKETEEN